MLRRLELVERLQRVYGAGEGRAPYREVLEAELRGILAELGELRVPEIPAHVLARRTESLPRWRYWLIAYKQACVKGAIYQALFYIFAAFGVLGGLGGATESWSVGLALLGFYLGIGLIFRAAAVRDFRKKSGKGPVQPLTTATAA